MKMISITILRRSHGGDIVFIDTDLPDAAHPFSERLMLQFKAARGTAEMYCAEHFPDVPIKEVL